MIEFSDVTFKYNTVTADGKNEDIAGVKELNITIKDGEFLVLTGGSGCGKTTVIRLINGLIPAFYNGEMSGTVTIGNRNIKDMSIYEVSEMVGSVFQNPRTQFFNVNTTDEIAFAAENRCMDSEKIREMIRKTADSMKINELLWRNIFELSGGEKQMIACAGVNVLSPDIIVLDEPSSNLDHHAIKKLERILRRWKEQGKTIIIAEHRLFYLKDLADRMLVMDSGKVKAEFDTKRLQALSYEESEALGLRPMELKDIPFRKKAEKPAPGYMELKNFTFAYKEKRHSISIPDLKIPVGSITAIIGHNGAGKSTLVRNICGLEKKCKGILVFNGKSMRYKERLHNCYMIMQDVNHQLFTESVIDEVMLSMTDKSLSEEVKKEKAGKILAELDLDDKTETHPMALSGGQKQRMAIASGIASDKPIIIFDEPTSGLDLHHMKQVADQMEKLKKLGKTVLIVTHDHEFILRCCDHIIHMAGGRIKETYDLNENTIDRLNDFISVKDGGNENV